jgi:hypothetical protein
MKTTPDLLDSIALITPDQAGTVVVTGSHGGNSAAQFVLALDQKPFAVMFNDAGGGKDDAGRVALGLLQAVGVLAVTYAHTSARIGDAEDGWHHGMVSAVNAIAREHGLHEGQLVSHAVTHLLTLQGC